MARGRQLPSPRVKRRNYLSSAALKEKLQQDGVASITGDGVIFFNLIHLMRILWKAGAKRTKEEELKER